MPPEPPDKDRVRLLHMRDAARQALGFAEGRTRANLDDDAMFRRATLHAIQEIGEAAARVSPAARSKAPSVPWHQVVGMRNFLVHDYFTVNLDLVWDVVCKDLRPLVAQLEAALRDWESA